MGEVVRLSVVSDPPPEATSEAFRSAWSAYPDTGRRRSSKLLSWPAWKKALKHVGEASLEGAVKRYAAEDKDHKRDCGAPGFHRWLKEGRYEHWLAPALTEVQNGPRFADERIRAEVVRVCGEGFTGAYLDRCTVDGTTLIAATDTAIRKMMEFRTLFRELGFSGMRKG